MSDIDWSDAIPLDEWEPFTREEHDEMVRVQTRREREEQGFHAKARLVIGDT